jgi:uncharacterized protein (DUF608 family)
MPIRTAIDNLQRPRSGVALGGIGGGSFTLFADGTTGDWNIANNLPMGTAPLLTWDQSSFLFITLRWQEGDGHPQMRLLQIPPRMGAAGIERHERLYIMPWLDGVERIEADLDFPGGKLRFHDSTMPMEVTLHAWSPFVPHHVAASSMPAVFLDLHIAAKPGRTFTVNAIASLRNLAGYDVPARLHTGSVVRGDGYVAALMGAANLPDRHPTNGQMGLVSLGADSSHYVNWEHIHPYWELTLRQPRLAGIDDTTGRIHTGRAMARCWSSVARAFTLSDGQSARHRFAVVWHFPHRAALSDTSSNELGYLEAAAGTTDLKAAYEGQGYSRQFADAAAVADYAAKHGDALQAKTARFTADLAATSLPGWLTGLVADQLNTLRTGTWLTADGSFGVIEGLLPDQSFAGLCTTDVAYYGSVMTAALFPELERAQWRAHARLQFPTGVILHSINKNFHYADPREANGHRVDLPGQFVQQALRLWAWTRDAAWLQEIWPHCTLALDYVLRERDHNRDLMPDMEGVMCSYDNFPMWGVAPYVTTQWLAAIALAREAAKAMGDTAWVKRCDEIIAKGAKTTVDATWNGAYFNLSADPVKGVDKGCLTDQTIGAWAAHLVDTSTGIDPAQVRSSLRAVFAMNFKPLQGLRNCQWPGDGHLHDVDKDCWVDQANTCWTGVEFAFASHALYAGETGIALQLLEQMRERHDRAGLAFDHQEFGGHYYRPMSAWSVLTAAAGLAIRDGVYTIAPRLPGDDQRLFVSYPQGGGWGHYVRRTLPNGWWHALEVSAGTLVLQGLRLTGSGKVAVTVDGRAVTATVDAHGDGVSISFAEPVTARTLLAVVITSP